MYQEFYRNSALLHLPLVALLLFLAVFVGTLAWLFVFQRKSPRFDRLADLPLELDERPRK
ncbi:CcoQ/FixQ family Cbb3-type cytochrome c oxidase assembly chaperone [Vulgatibacter incomptus]|uniref:Uncharacterized protein n=1 Tax=Vulgatibacter incomptus TaxID=1391653 RepID=A0A0K1PHI8_9BACT|nr:CcoQ/FixQ family Cbb3-type cytochrome c oxidase assembly chaperone [Vulgatibacter incomptus]AKU92985.1 hypothetical protein AKJ08_3372 [Vulgatibacter incomptus]